MKLEYLYPELGNLYGDPGSMRYLRLSVPDAEYTETHIGEKPAFLEDADIRFVYCGPMTERGQRIALDSLRPYAASFSDRFSDCCFLFTGNSLELTGQRIETGDEVLTALGIFPFYSKLDVQNRYNSLFLGERDGTDIVGFNSRFSHSFPEGELSGFASVTRGIGLNENCSFEGIVSGGFIGTYLLGPLLVMNPLLTQKIMGSMGIENPVPAFFDDAMAAYQTRLAEFRDEKRKLD